MRSSSWLMLLLLLRAAFDQPTVTSAAALTTRRASLCMSSSSSSATPTAVPVRVSTVLIVGGGFAGLGATVTLANAGVDCQLVEQGRGLGGRVTTRRVRGSDFTFDHGAQYFSPKPDSQFYDLCVELEKEGVIAKWAKGRLGKIKTEVTGAVVHSTFVPFGDDKVAFVGSPSQSYVGKAILARCKRPPAVSLGTRAAPGSLRPAPDSDGNSGWTIETHAKEQPDVRVTSRHRFVLACGSASSTFNVISPAAPSLAEEAGKVVSSPCWALMVAFDKPLLSSAEQGWDGVQVEGSSEVSWMARDNTKPGRSTGEGGVETWVVHSSPAFAAEVDAAVSLSNGSGSGRDAAAQAAVGKMLAALFRAVGQAPRATVYAEAFRWNAAFPLSVAVNKDKQECFFDSELELGLAGDWCIGPRVGDAYQSGVAAGIAVLKKLGLESNSQKL